MRCLERNKTQFTYLTFKEKTEVTDAGGYKTGEIQVKYNTAVTYYGNISGAQGSAQAEMFGTNIDYDKIIIVEDVACPIDENSVLFVDKSPTYDGSGNPLYDYIVKRVVRTKNSGTSYAIKRVR